MASLCRILCKGTPRKDKEKRLKAADNPSDGLVRSSERREREQDNFSTAATPFQQAQTRSQQEQPPFGHVHRELQFGSAGDAGPSVVHADTSHAQPSATQSDAESDAEPETDAGQPADPPPHAEPPAEPPSHADPPAEQLPSTPVVARSQPPPTPHTQPWQGTPTQYVAPLSMRANMSASETSPAMKYIYGIPVDFTTSLTEEEIRQGLFSTRVIHHEEPAHVVKDSRFDTVPSFQPVNCRGAEVTFEHTSFSQVEYNKLDRWGILQAESIALHYSAEDSNLQEMQEHNRVQMTHYEEEGIRLENVRLSCREDLTRANRKRKADVQQAMAAIRQARDSALQAAAAAERVRECDRQVLHAQDQLINERSEQFQGAEERQAKKAKDLSQFESTPGFDEGKRVVELGMLARSSEFKKPARMWQAT